MIFAEFKAAVLEELGTDGTRRGIETFRTRAIRDAMIDLQRYIRAFRQGHATVYTANDLVTKACAMIGPLPAQAKPKAFYIYKVETAPAPAPSQEITSWDDLAALATIAMPTGQIKIWVDEDTGSFMVTQLLAGTDETDTDAGIQRPADFADPGNARVWYKK